MDELQKSILKTLKLFDFFNYPLNINQIKKNLLNNTATTIGIQDSLNILLKSNLIIEHAGLYALPKREYLFPLRVKSEEISQYKIKILKKAIFLLNLNPFVKGAILFGSLAFKNSNIRSDIDLMIISRHQKIWTARLLTKMMMILAGINRKKNLEHAPDKICLNHFIDEKHLEVPFQNVYNAIMYKNGIVVLDKGLNLKEIFPKINTWIYTHDFQKEPNQQQATNKKTFLERISKKIQILIMTKKAMDIANRKQIRICDQYLAFHDIDRESSNLEKLNQIIHT